VSPVPLTSAAMLHVEVRALSGPGQTDHRCCAMATRLRIAVQPILVQLPCCIMQCLVVIRSIAQVVWTGSHL